GGRRRAAGRLCRGDRHAAAAFASMKVVQLLLFSLPLSAAAAPLPSPAAFSRPPAAARPWVFAYWMDGNVTREGITADLEAMKAQGIGGFTFFACALGSPTGPQRFLSDSWRGLFRHMTDEAARLGL